MSGALSGIGCLIFLFCGCYAIAAMSNFRRGQAMTNNFGNAVRLFVLASLYGLMKFAFHKFAA